MNEKGYTTTNEKLKAIIKAGALACIGLALVYGGLCYLGATVSLFNDVNAVQTQVIVNITQGLLGNVGKTVLAVAVALACLTTSIGLTSATGQYFANLTKGKISYGKIVLCIGLALVYGGLCYLGATVSLFNDVNAVQTQVIVNITQGLLGNVGKTVLAVAVALACLTTSIGLTSATGQYFANLTKGKISYGKIVLAV